MNTVEDDGQRLSGRECILVNGEPRLWFIETDMILAEYGQEGPLRAISYVRNRLGRGEVGDSAVELFKQHYIVRSRFDEP